MRTIRENLPRGFKAKAERLALTVRDSVQRKPWQACPARLLAKKLGYETWAMSDLLGLLKSGVVEVPGDLTMRIEHLDHLCTVGCGVHAAVLHGCGLIVYNCANSPARQESDIMHELAHVILDHKDCYVDQSLDFNLVNINPQIEAEANWLGAALQVPEKGIFIHARRGLTNIEIAKIFGASEERVQHRRNCLGIDRRLRLM